MSEDEVLAVTEGWCLTPAGGVGIVAASLLADVGRETPTAQLPSLLSSTHGARAPS